VILLLHGVYGSHWAWAAKGAAHLTAAALVAEGALPPVILCMPSDGLWGDGSGYVAHGSQDFERWIIDEAPAAARLAYDAGSSPLLVCGLSMGGFAALRLAGKYPDRITAAAGHSSLTRTAQLDDLIVEPRVGWSREPADCDLLAALLGAPSALPPLRFDCGADDPYLAANRDLHAALDAAGIPHEYAERRGGHDWPYWTRELGASLRFFGAVLNETNGRSAS
jgi:S-formylglutathione hydrolase FrmB